MEDLKNTGLGHPKATQRPPQAIPRASQGQPRDAQGPPGGLQKFAQVIFQVARAPQALPRTLSMVPGALPRPPRKVHANLPGCPRGVRRGSTGGYIDHEITKLNPMALILASFACQLLCASSRETHYHFGLLCREGPSMLTLPYHVCPHILK